ncbi:amidohydrolase [Devosia sp. 63-57]|uniref:amidohydrolase n=1 Tax=Devosia sp. 63-57 TaxID=1895751 RepID=UPI00086C1DA2|nr:amidohydrolase [Devosia sp. 63-57]ODT47140.1 MAG: N-acyl-L-amino acid amidohydrolase [Pelagibacterium sp. SCN 63-126]ODU88954.1 MAG: N-acyl-L-amino acid amidohydrolase [Pelagibacterium sp. SCN 63-17]OJX43149.1 MAG: N-acyl-L-amino acid amidohydrolase [Devosia sp. 63-57]
MNDHIEKLLDGVREQVIAWRRHMHAHPELSFEEHETAAFIVARLEEIGGIEISRPSGTSVVGRLRGNRPGPTIAIRADFDALPITEETGAPYASRNPGVMHACGHDGHTAMLLGTATVLAQLRDNFAGEIRLLFENGEETPPGGAKGMIEGGAMDGVDRVIGLHLWSPLEVGQLHINPRRMMAACDIFRIEVKGVGGHVGAPHRAVDPIAIGCQIVTNLQHLVARGIDPVEAAVVGVTEFHAGQSVGVIPATAVIGGGTNMFDPAVRDLIERRIGEIAVGICAAHGATCDYSYTRVYDTVINDPETAAIVATTARDLFGTERVEERDPIMPGEDFSAFGQVAPSCFILVGAGNRAKGITAAHHDARFDIDEDALDNGVRLSVNALLALLKHG